MKLTKDQVYIRKLQVYNTQSIHQIKPNSPLEGRPHCTNVLNIPLTFGASWPMPHQMPHQHVTASMAFFLFFFLPFLGRSIDPCLFSLGLLSPALMPHFARP